MLMHKGKLDDGRRFLSPSSVTALEKNRMKEGVDPAPSLNMLTMTAKYATNPCRIPFDEFREHVLVSTEVNYLGNIGTYRKNGTEYGMGGAACSRAGHYLVAAFLANMSC